MATVSTALKTFDQMTRPLQQVTQALNLTIVSMNSFTNYANADIKITNTLNTARTAIQNTNTGLNQLVDSQDNAANAQNELNNELNKGVNASNGLGNKVKGLIGDYLGYQTIKNGMDATDNYINQNSRIALINDGLQTQAELQNKIYQAAQRSRGSYGETVSSVTQLGLVAKDAFSSNDETIAFAELINKSFKMSGAGASEASNGMYQLTQAMAEGRLQGDGFSSVMENAPMLAQAIATYTGKSIGELREMSSEGQITGDIIKNSLFSAAGDINAKFATMPQTFGSIWTSIKNEAVMNFSSIMQKANSFINSDVGASIINTISNSIMILSYVLGYVIDGAINIATFFNDNWTMIEPVIWGIVAAIAAYNIAMFICNAITMIKSISDGIAAASAALHAGNTLFQAAATTTATGAQVGLNAALLACPITWIIIGIIALIVVIYAAVGAVNHFAGTSWSATGIIVGAFAVLGAFIWNTVVGVINAIIQFLWTRFVEPWIGIIEWVLNVFNGGFNSFGDAVANLLGQIISWFLSLGKVVTKIIDAIFGKNWTAGLSSLQDSVLSWGKNEKAITLERKAPAINSRIEYGQAWDSGYNFGENIASKFSINNLLGDIDKASKQPPIPDLSAWNAAQGPGELSMGGLDKDSNEHLKNIDDKIDVSNEHLELLRDLAEQDSIQNFVTLSPTVQVETGDIRETADVNMIISKIEAYMENELVNSAEGVYI